MAGSEGSPFLHVSSDWAITRQQSPRFRAALVQSANRIGSDFAEVAMRDISRAVALLLVCYPLLLLTQNPAGQLPTPDQNSILNLYDAFGYQKRGTILDWGFSAFVRYK